MLVGHIFKKIYDDTILYLTIIRNMFIDMDSKNQLNAYHNLL